MRVILSTFCEEAEQAAGGTYALWFFSFTSPFRVDMAIRSSQSYYLRACFTINI